MATLWCVLLAATESRWLSNLYTACFVVVFVAKLWKELRRSMKE